MEQKTLPNATAALVLGILSIPVTCLCYGIIGLIMGILAIVFGSQAIRLDEKNPGVYKDVQNAKIGKILGIISVVIAAFYLLFLALIIAGAIAEPEFMEEIIQQVS